MRRLRPTQDQVSKNRQENERPRFHEIPLALMNRFRSGGEAALSAELSLDVRRMWLRNCGRDDRLVADHGREARHPFLDERLMGLILSLPLGCIADLRQGPGKQTGVLSLIHCAISRQNTPNAISRMSPDPRLPAFS